METPAVGQIYALLPKVMDAVGAIGKNRRSGGDGGPNYAFRGIDEVYNAVQPAFIKHGISIVPVSMKVGSREAIPRQNKSPLMFTIIEATYRFYAGDGSYVEAVTIGEGMDTSDKGCNKAMSAAMKYAMFQVLCIPTEESKDSENDHHERPSNLPASPPPAKPAAGKLPLTAHGKAMEKQIKSIASSYCKSFAIDPKKFSKPAFVAFARKALGLTDNVDIDMGNPENWDDDAIKQVSDAIAGHKSEAA